MVHWFQVEQYKPYIGDGATVVASPHKVYGPQNNDLALQLRKRGIDYQLALIDDANYVADALHIGQDVG